MTPPRVSDDSGSTLPGPGGDFTITYGHDIKLINNVVHACGTGINFWSPVGGNSELHGNIVYDNGWIGVTRSHGPGIYTQNRAENNDTRLIGENIVIDNYSLPLQIYGSAAAHVHNFQVEHNILSVRTGSDRNFALLGGVGYCTGLHAVRNALYGVDLHVGWFEADSGNDMSAISNSLYRGTIVTQAFVTNLVVEDNFVWTNAPAPGGPMVFLYPNAYEPKRANLAIFTWDVPGEVEVELGGLLDAGDGYELRYATNFYGAPVLAGTYTGIPVPVPMSAEFAAFVILPSDPVTSTTGSTTTTSSTTLTTTTTSPSSTTTSPSSTTTTSSTTSTILTTTTTSLTTSTTTAVGDTYYVRIGGNDGNDGLSPTDLGGGVGPKATILNAVNTVNAAGAGYHTIDIGAGTFRSLNPSLSRTMRIVGTGTGSTFLDGPNSASLYHFVISGVGDAAAERPLLFRDFTFVNTNAANGNMVLAGGGEPFHVRFEDVSADNFEGLLYGIRMNNNSPGMVGNGDWTFRNFSATNIQSDAINWLFLRSNAFDITPRTQRWTFDGCTITDNGTIYGSLTDNRWVVEGFRMTNSVWSRNGGNGSFGLNGSTTTDFLGTNRIDHCTIEDNNDYGVWAPRMGNGAALIIRNSTLRETNAQHDQCVHVYVTIPFGNTIGQIRVVDSEFDSTPGCGVYSKGLYIEDDGATQTSPIELKNVNFNACATGLMITGAVANLWYIDPDLSGAAIDPGKTLVSGGRMTRYGDANLDGVVDAQDIAAVGGFPFPNIAQGATWADGDFDFDGDVDADDHAWLPLPESLILIVK